MHKLFWLAAACICLSPLAPALDNLGRMTSEDIIGHRFTLIEVNGEKPAGDREISFEVKEDLMIFGRVCNTFRGKAALKGDILTLPQAATTRMACPDEGLAKLESGLLKMLANGALLTLAGDRLTLRRDDAVLVFAVSPAGGEKKPEPEEAKGAVSTDDLIGRRFILKKANGEDFVMEMQEQQPYIDFADGLRISGSACNGFTGPGELKDGVLFLKNAAATMKMCINPKLSQYERDFHKLLRDGAKISLDGMTLTLSGDGVTYVYEVE